MPGERRPSFLFPTHLERQMTIPYACTTPLPDGGVHTRPGELVGRGAEWARITAVLAAARSGRGRAVLVTGEPGVGKTRFAAEAVGAAEAAGMVTARGRAGTVGPAVPYRPLVEALLALVRAEPPAQHRLGRYGPVLARLLDDARGTGVSALSPLVVAEAVLRLTSVVGRGRGCLLVLDDLHEADAGTLSVVEYLLGNVGPLPAVLLLTTGSAPGPAAELAARAREDGTAAVLDLAPLGRTDVRLLLSSELGVAPEQVSPALVRRAATGGAGIPFVVRALAHDPAPVPTALVEHVRLRAERLGPSGVELLGMAAVFGGRFPAPVLRHATGRTDAGLCALLRAAVAASLVVPDGPGTDWYAFRFPLAADALRSALGPVEQPALARRAAAALAELHPGLPGVWCGHAAELHERAGDTGEAVRLYGEAADRATAEGATERALTLLRRAHDLLDAATAPELHATVLERLLDAVARSGRLDRLPAGAGPETLGSPCLPGPRRAGLHARLAEIHALAGRPAEALRQLDLARWLLGERPDDGAGAAPDDRAGGVPDHRAGADPDHRAAVAPDDRAGTVVDDPAAAVVDLAAACVEPSRLAPERLRTAEDCARRAVGRGGGPEVVGRALLVLGGLDERGAPGHFARARALADAHRLPGLRVAAEAGIARLAVERDGRAGPAEQARQAALRMGLLPTAHEAGFALALERVRRGAFGAARELIQEGGAEAARLGLGRADALWRLADAVRWAHLGRRAEMLDALERLAAPVDAAPGVRPMAYGLARAFCSLLEEDHEAAEREWAQALAYDAENPATGDFGRHGVVLLLGVLAGRMGRHHHERVAAASAAGTRWNRPFVGLAHAVLLGREGRAAEASAAAAVAFDAAGPYPLARHLSQRLVARSAYEDGWGAPVAWLREAEEYVHGAGLPAVAGACRALLRGMGASVRQRRTGTEQVPPGLRRCGITVREFEVARLLAERFGNRDIAGRLHISPRTVEKHVASLLQKTGHPNRAAFASAARDLVAGSAS
ncbi:AAA family ATPase [Streptomyces sp. NPDC085481]|uniref:helix-turn-helix transcriptional regulator n=1 Tax=Streptomyces sp. NPDC085481 TaxID=3365727 RepID=UPI0037D2BD40